MTNFERLKQMNADELADFLNSVYINGYIDGGSFSHICETAYDKNWLESEVQE